MGRLIASLTATGLWLLASPHIGETLRLLLLTIAVVGFVALHRSRSSVPVRQAAVVSTLLLALAVSIAPRDSNDVWSYVMYGRTVAVHHDSPYTHTPNEYPGDPLLRDVEPGWAHVGSVYGPVFTAASAVGARVSGDSPVVNRLWHQSLAALAVLGFATVVARRTRSAAPLIALCLNPATIAMVNGGHNDLLMGVIVAAAACASSIRSKSVLVAAGVLIKASAVIPAVALIASTKDRRAAAATSLVAATVVVATYALAGGTDAIRPLLEGGGVTSRASLWSVPQALFGDGPWLTVAWALCIAAAVWFARKQSSVNAACMVTIAAIASAPYVLPWYCGWVLPLAALANSRWTPVALVQSLALLVAYTVRPGATIDSPIVEIVTTASVPLATVACIAWLISMARKDGLEQSECASDPSKTATSPPS